MIRAKLEIGAQAVFVGLARAYRGTIIGIGYTGDILGPRTGIILELRDGGECEVALDDWLVPAEAFKMTSWDGWTVRPYTWEITND